MVALSLSIGVAVTGGTASAQTNEEKLTFPVAGTQDTDTSALTLGVKFTTSVPGKVVGVEFHRASTANNGRAVQLWSPTGTLLASASTPSATTLGFNRGNFTTPITVAAGQTFTASYLAPRGRYTARNNAFTEPRTSGGITAPANAGVYQYGKRARFPTSNFQASDYYVTPVFVPDVVAPPTTSTSPPTSTTTVPPTSTPTPTSTTTVPPPAGCNTTNPAWTTSDQLGSWENNSYVVNNNVWNRGEAGPQTIYADAWNRWCIISDQPGSGVDDSVKSYADTQKHVSIPLSSMTSIPSTFNVTTPDGGGTVPANGKQWNAAYDLWLDNFGTEVMVWNNWTANWQYWYNTYKGEIATIDGVNYYAYRNANSTAMWFIRQDVTNQGSVDLASVLRWAVGKGWIKNTQTLGEIEYGFEVLYTGTPTTFTLNDYTLSTS